MAAVVIIWFILALIIGNWGGKRKLGFAGAFFISLLFSPVIGLIVTAVSDPKDFSKEESNSLINQAYKKGEEGNYEEAIDILHQSLERNGQEPKAHYNLACYYSMLNKTDLAFQHLSRAVENGYSNYERIQEEPELENVRNIEKFAAFADKGFRLS